MNGAFAEAPETGTRQHKTEKPPERLSFSSLPPLLLGKDTKKRALVSRHLFGWTKTPAALGKDLRGNNQIIER